MHGKKAYEVEKEIAGSGDGFGEVVDEALAKKFAFIANALTIKMNDLRPWYETARVQLSDTSAEIWKGQRCRVGQLIVMTHISVGEATNKPTTQEIAIERGGEKIVLNRDVPSAINITVDWDGQVILTEGDRIVSTTYGGTSANVITISCSGYEIKA